MNEAFPKPKILVTGATGFVGSRLATHFEDAGFPVKSLLRRTHNRSELPAGEIILGSLPFDIPLKALKDVECVVHCATATHNPSDAEFDAVNVEGLRQLIRLAEVAGVKRLIFLSSQSVTTGANSPYARTKKISEKLLLEADIPVSIIRPGLVVGPGKNAGLFERMVDTVEKLPILPFLGGGKAIIQPIWVEDLCRVIIELSQETSGDSHTYQLGDPDGIDLKGFLQAIGFGLKGKNPLSISLPLQPVEWAVKLGETLGIPLPIGSSNIQGLKSVARMDTKEDMERFQISYPHLVDKISETAKDRESYFLGKKPVRVLQVGAGKIAMIHSLSLTRRAGVQVVGMVDPNKNATAFLEKAGIPLRHFSDLEEGLKETQPDGVVVTAPSFTHFEVAKKCLERGLSVFLEKPSVISPEQATELRALANQKPQAKIAVGYQVPLTSTARHLKRRLNPNDLGSPQRFFAYSFQSHILHSKPRWETTRSLSGGGVLINFSSHALSLVEEFFPDAKLGQADLYSIYSEEVEDAASISFGDTGNLITSWSVTGLDETLLAVWIETDRAMIRLSNVGYTVYQGGKRESLHETELPSVFDPAPGLSGSGFDFEHESWLREIRGTSKQSTSLARAERIEKIIHHAYRSKVQPDPEVGVRLLDWALEFDETAKKTGKWVAP